MGAGWQSTLTLCFVGFCYAVTIHEQVISLDTGTQEMRDVSDPIRSDRIVSDF